MAQEFSVSVDLRLLLQVQENLLARVGLYANLALAVEEVAKAGAERWAEAVKVVPGLWVGERQAYVASIKTQQTGPYAWEVSSNYKYVEDIESGRPPYDLKKMLNTSMKVRVNKKGRRYLIIPFRHNSPGNIALAPAMPKGVYAEAKDLAASRVVGGYGRESGTGAHSLKTKLPYKVAARKYVWGGRLPPGLAPKLKTEHKADPYAGMVRMKTATGGSQYLTFRVMIEGSPGWVIPARPGMWIAKQVAASMQRTADIDIPAAIVKDVA